MAAPPLVTPAVGQMAPDFKLRGAGGLWYSLSEHRGEKNVMLVFYPFAFSGVCTHQLPEVQAALPRFEAADTVVYGISTDSHHSNTAFAEKLGLSFALLSDWMRVTTRDYGVLLPEVGYAWRSSFVIGKDGRVLWKDVSEDMGDKAKVPSLEGALAALSAQPAR